MTLTSSLSRALQHQPSALASRFQGRSRSFAEFGDRVARLAGAFQALGVRPGQSIAMLALNSDHYLEYTMAVLWAGAVMNPCNTRWSQLEIVYSLDDAASVLLLVDDSYLELGRAAARDSKTVRQVIHVGDGNAPAGMLSFEALIHGHAPVAAFDGKDDDLAGVFYTGGTTGSPKGVMLTHGNLWSGAMCYLLEGLCPPGAVYLHATPMFHLGDMGLSIATLVRGGGHRFVPSFDAGAVIESLVNEGVTDIQLVPTMVQRIVDHPSMRAAAGKLSLQRMMFGASPMSEALLQRTLDAMPGVQIAQGYGMTEMSPMITFNPFANLSPQGRSTGKLFAAGRPTFAVEVKIADEQGREVPRGVVGEVLARGPTVMQGYLNKPEETAKALQGGWMHTGDGAYMDQDGYLYVVDRIKDMIISGGENVYSVEVENAIAHHPAVASVAVIGIPDDDWGERVAAFVVLKAGQSLDGEAIRAHCKQWIAGYKCPRTVVFMDALPLSGPGKVLKSELRKPYWAARSAAVA